jgi:hypothetical protein
VTRTREATIHISQNARSVGGIWLMWAREFQSVGDGGRDLAANRGINDRHDLFGAADADSHPRDSWIDKGNKS